LSPASHPESTKRDKWTARVARFLFERLGFDDLQYLAAKKRVPIHRTSIFYFLGGMALFLFVVQVITGTLLSLYYKPSPDQAFESVRAIMTEIEFGWLIRSVHSWSANLLIGVLFLHLLTAYIMRAYRRPREFTWFTGLALLAMFLAFGFSGYLLPWNELSFFATSVGTKITEYVPLVGHPLKLLARSGEEVTGDTLARFYSLHVVILPLAVLAILGVHLYLVQKHGMSVPDGEAARHGGADKVPSMPFVPHFLLRDMVGWCVALGLLAALAAFLPWELGQKANPFESAPPVKPEWYFLFMFATLEQLPGEIFGIEGPTVGVLFFGLCGLIVLLVPFLDWGAGRGRPRRILNFLATWAVFAFIFQTAVGLGVLFESQVKDPTQATRVLGLAVLYSGVATLLFWTVVFAVNRRYRNAPGGPSQSGLLGILVLAGMLVTVPAIAADKPSPKAGEKPAAKVSEAAATKAAAKPGEKPQPRPNQCLDCHGNSDVWEGDQLRLYVTAKDMAGDIHWQKSLRCVDCHGGNPDTDKVNEAHAEEDGFRRLRSAPDTAKSPEPVKVVELCGGCHAKIDYMKNYSPMVRTDQLAEYWTSGHGKRLKATGDAKVAICVSCHDKPHGNGQDKSKHGVHVIADLDSPVYPKQLAKTCAKCHADEKLMAGYQYHARPIGHDQYALWRQSVHAQALLEKDDLSAATCNDCHGNHGAVPPNVASVANACGNCHGKIAGLFAATRMKHAFEEVLLPGCATCHTNHFIRPPTIEMLHTERGEVCVQCHAGGKHGATLGGSDKLWTLADQFNELRRQIDLAQEKIQDAERLGMAVRGPKSDRDTDPRIYLRKASDALANARVEIHSFALDRVEEIVAGGVQVAGEVQESAEEALREHTARRVWLFASLAPIFLVVILLLLYIRTLPARS
jgi:quinol-cytochrome oxidoreductase complex cytochrome b subunit